MATSNNDRISSARLLDTIKGLQESRHLGSEPEVVTETVTEQYPPAGDYANEEAIYNAYPELPFEQPGEIRVLAKILAEPQTIPTYDNEPIAILNKSAQVPASVGDTASMAMVDEEFDDVSSYTGYAVFYNGSGKAMCVHFSNGTIDDAGYFAYVISNSTTTKTKRTIKQDYLPNADWNVNDPDADGYVEGRTHWVEISETEGTVRVQTGAEMGNFAMGTCDKFGAVKGFAYPNGEYNPNRIGEVIDITVDGQTMQFSYVGEDANGNAITPTTIEEINETLSTTNIGILFLKDENGIMVYIAYPNVTNNDICTAFLASEVVHKLDIKYYEHHNRTHIDYRLTNYSDWDANADEDSLFNSAGIGYGSTRREIAFIRAGLSGGQIEFDTSISPLTGNIVNGVNVDNFSYLVCRNLQKMATLTRRAGNANGRIIDFITGCSSFKNMTDDSSFNGYCKRVADAQLQYYKSNGEKTYRLDFIGPKTAFVYNSENEQITTGAFELQIEIPTSFNNPRFLPLQHNYTVEDLPSYKEQKWTSGETNTLYDLPYRYVICDEQENAKLLPFEWNMTNLTRWQGGTYTADEIVAKQRSSFTTNSQIPKNFNAIVPVLVTSSSTSITTSHFTLAHLKFGWQQANGELRIKFADSLPQELVGIDSLLIQYFGS